MYAILCLLILLLSIGGAESTELISCLPAKLLGRGFVTKFYDYELSSKAGWEPDFFKSGYRTNLLGTKNGIHNIDFEHEGPWDIRSVYEFIYGQRTKYTNFVTEYTGYFFAKEAGKYTFSLTANSGASLQLGSNGICCDDVLCSVTEDSFYALTTTKDGSRVSLKSVSFDLKKNLYYPMKLVYFNSQGDSSLSLTMKNPYGDVISDLSDYVWQVTFKGSICYTTVYGLWSGTSRTISTHKVANTKHHTETVHVLDPKPRSTATLTWDHPKTSTKIQDNGPTVMVVVYVPRLRTTIHEYWNGEREETDSFIGDDQVATIRVKHPRKRVHAFLTEDIPSKSIELIEDGEKLRIIEHRPRETVRVEEFWNGETEETDSFIGDDQVATIRVKHPRKRVHAFVTEDIPSKSIELIEDGEKLRIIEHRPRETVRVEEFWNGETEETDSFIGDDQVATIRVKHPRKRVHAFLTEDIPSKSIELIEDGEKLRIIEHRPRETVRVEEYWNEETEETDSFIGDDQVATIRVKHPRKRVHAFLTEDIPSKSIELIEDGEKLRIIEHRPRETVRVEEYWNEETEETDSFIGDDQVATIRVKQPRKRVHAFLTEDIPSKSIELIEDGEKLRIIEHRPRETVRVEEFWNGETEETDSFIGDDQVATIRVKHPRKRVHAFLTEDIPSKSIELIEDGEKLRIIEHRPRETVRVEEYWNEETEETDSFIGDDQVATIRVKHPRKRVHAFLTEDIPSKSIELIEDGEKLRIIEHRPRETVRVEEFWNGETEETDSFIGDDQVATIRVKHPRKRVHAFVTEDIPSKSIELIEDGEKLRIIEHRPRETVRVEEFWNGETEETDSFIGDDQVATIRVKHPRKRVHAFLTEDIPSKSIELIEDGEKLRIIEHRPRETVRVEEYWNEETEETDSFIGDDQVATIRVKHPRKRVHAFLTEDIPSKSIELIEDGEKLRIIEHRPRETVRVEEYWNEETEETDSFIGDDQVATIRVKQPRKRVHAFLTEDIPSKSIELIEDGEKLRIIEHRPRETVRVEEFWNGETEETDSFIGDDQVATIRVKHPRKRVHAFLTEDIPSKSIELIEDGEKLRIIEHRPRETVRVEEYWNEETEETDSFIGDDQVATIRVKHPRKRVHAFLTEDIPSKSIELIEDGEKLRIIEHRPRETVRVEEFWNGETEETDSFIGDDQVATIRVKHPRKRVHAFVTEDIPSKSIELIEDGEKLRIIEHRPRETVRVEEYWNEETEETDSFIGDDQVATIRVKHPRKRVHAFLTEDIPSKSIELIEDGEKLRIIEHRPRETVRVEEFWNGETEETDSFIGDDQVATIRVKHPRKRVHAFLTEDIPSKSIELIEDGEKLRIIEHRPRETVRVEEYWNEETEETDSFIGDDQVATIRVKHPRKRVHAFVTEDIPSKSIESIEDGEKLRIIEHRPRSISPIDESLQDIQNTTETSAEADQMASHAVGNSRGHAFASGMEGMMNSSSVDAGVTNSVVEHELSQPVNAAEFWDGENYQIEVPTGGDQVVALRPEIEELEGKANPFEVDLSDRPVAALSPLYGLVSKQMTDFPSETHKDLFGASERTSSSTKLERELEKSAGITKAWSNPVEDQIHDGSLLSVNVSVNFTTSILAPEKTDTDKFSVNGMSLNETDRGLCFLTFPEAQFWQACGTPSCEWDGSLALPYTQVAIEADAHSNDSLELARNSESLDRDKANLTRSEKTSRSSTALDESGISSGEDARFVHLANSVVYPTSASSDSHSETRQEYSDPVGMSLCPLSCPSLPRVSSGESATARITSSISEPGTEISPVSYFPLSLNLPDFMNAVNPAIVTESANLSQLGNCEVPHCTSQYGDTSVGVDYDSGVRRSPLDENLDSYATVICKDHCTLNVDSSRLSNQSSDEQKLDLSPVSPVFDRSISGFITFEKASSSLKLPTTTLKISSQVVLFESAACKIYLEMITVAIWSLLWLL